MLRVRSATLQFLMKSRPRASCQSIGVDLMIGGARRFGRRSCEGRSAGAARPPAAIASTFRSEKACAVSVYESWLQVTRLAIAALLCPVTLMTTAAASLSAGAQIAMSRTLVPVIMLSVASSATCA